MTDAAWCRVCGKPCELAELVRVVPLDGGAPYHVHRPFVSAPCFGAGVPSALVARIEPTEPNAHPVDRATWPRVDGAPRGAAR